MKQRSGNEDLSWEGVKESPTWLPSNLKGFKAGSGQQWM